MVRARGRTVTMLASVLALPAAASALAHDHWAANARAPIRVK